MIQVEDTTRVRMLMMVSTMFGNGGMWWLWRRWEQGIHTLKLAENVDYLTFLSDYETQLNQVKDLHNGTEQKLVRLEKIVCELAKKKSRFTNGFGYFVGVLVIVLVLIGMVLIFN